MNNLCYAGAKVVNKFNVRAREAIFFEKTMISCCAEIEKLEINNMTWFAPFAKKVSSFTRPIKPIVFQCLWRWSFKKKCHQSVTKCHPKSWWNLGETFSTGFTLQLSLYQYNTPYRWNLKLFFANCSKKILSEGSAKSHKRVRKNP